MWLKIGSNKAKVNGKPVTISASAKLIEGRTFVPLRFISQSLGETVHWDHSSKTVTVGGDRYGNIQKSAWLGQYGNWYYTGSGFLTALYVYQKTPNSISFVSQTGYRYDPTGGKLYGYQMPWRYQDYYGEAKLISANKASFSSRSCRAVLELVHQDIYVYQTSGVGTCDFTGLGMYEGYDSSVYKKY